MKFSFLMCVNQVQPFLDKAILSMVNQDYLEKYEVLIVANNCSDSLYEILIGYCLRFENIRLYRTSIGQLAFNLNYGIDLAQGEYVIRMDADDICFPDRLSQTAAILETYNYPDVLGGLAIKIDELGTELGRLGRARSGVKLSRSLCFQNPIIHPATAIKRESLIRVRGYLGGINCEDYDLWLRMDRLGMEMVVTDFYPICYRINSYQVKGSRVAYSDGVSLRLREALFRCSFLYFLGLVMGLGKFFIYSVMGKMK